MCYLFTAHYSYTVLIRQDEDVTNSDHSISVVYQ